MPRYAKTFGLLIVISLLIPVVLGHFKSIPDNLSFRILSPTDGSHVQSPVLLKLEINGSTIGLPILGLDHLHLSIDNGPERAVYKYKDRDELSLPLTQGRHKISVELAGPTHRALLPSKEVSFVVDRGIEG